MIVKVTSDTHGYLPTIDEPFDLLLICGDICPAHDHYFAFQKEWVENEFVNWVNGLPFKDEFARVIMTPGNHDFVFERWHQPDFDHLKRITNGRLIVLKNNVFDFEYLDDEEGIKTVKIFGTPYCKVFGNWAFMVSDEKLKEKYADIPEGVDILITHDAPSINKLGLIHEGWSAGVDAGNKVLDAAIREKKPKYVFCGHIHSGNHAFDTVNVNDNDPEDDEEVLVKMANASYINERYHPAYDIITFEYK